jgi:hypothetical protein
MPKPEIPEDPTYREILELLGRLDERKLKVILSFIRSLL